MYQERVEEAIQAFRNGEMIIVMDDEDRENEGDLVLAGIFSTPEKINFMAQEARGLICVCITKELAQKLDLPPMVANNDSNHTTAFTVSIDAKAAKTGISAFERDMTIGLLCGENTVPSDFVRPGHIFPLIAKEGGVLVRTGHTEAGVDLCKIAGLKPVSVICEIMKEDGSMARRGDKFLLDFAQKHNLKILYVSDLVAHRMRNENLLQLLDSQKSSFMDLACQKQTFCDHFAREHIAFCFDGEQLEVPLVRFHIIQDDYLLLAQKENLDFLLRTVERLRKEGGYLIFLRDGGSRDGVAKNFGIGAQLLKCLNIKRFRLITSSSREYNALGGFDLKIEESIEV
ncbi:bifunctional 3,4-dihydroxy-2-butanone 4-phosphate synthase/GTP cyclohydrolase II [Helicobacter mustelae]|uniref:3,4-dihydroxy-2-butanone 4-phosphate synthase n=1 Tax=Helicobacter mustelae (strain ATCC 43772 / CCUG 25715 / CIP 103759 / LMG 18044 / NCTC 12198 / R85-136P) TaxID=679897 RepID=D3UIY3_HELM1|nr:bifunctional 3,4-dihydroxy-2-butanone 4-phosphate synthase/GTP cyclohydrolase II [Helicobacter mustelae]CBG40458.1 GTP cyclohydrolase II / 3,4-dihydroxy-2-butanone 4-phosphate synthase [Helicobacter mustelae 12198]SQH71957.1 GTP cyclohydrolase II [Helicobacter mustelae]STP13101.1 GTP cyclohydrolase II [Helicobacter mustelae]